MGQAEKYPPVSVFADNDFPPVVNFRSLGKLPERSLNSCAFSALADYM